jgi:hypothetical protein
MRRIPLREGRTIRVANDIDAEVEAIEALSLAIINGFCNLFL